LVVGVNIVAFIGFDDFFVDVEGRNETMLYIVLAYLKGPFTVFVAEVVDLQLVTHWHSLFDLFSPFLQVQVVFHSLNENDTLAQQLVFHHFQLDFHLFFVFLFFVLLPGDYQVSQLRVIGKCPDHVLVVLTVDLFIEVVLFHSQNGGTGSCHVFT